MDKPRLLREPEAWRLIAAELAASRDPFHDGFLCIQAERLYGRGLVDRSTVGGMTERARAHVMLLPDVDSSFRSPSAYGADDGDPRELRQYRILAALWMALEAEDESRAGKEGR